MFHKLVIVDCPRLNHVNGVERLCLALLDQSCATIRAETVTNLRTTLLDKGMIFGRASRELKVLSWDKEIIGESSPC